MDKIKKDFVNDLFKFLNQDIQQLNDGQCRKLAAAFQRKALIPYDAILPIREYSGGVLTQHFNIDDANLCRKFLATLHFRINLLLTAFFKGEEIEDFGDRRINFTMSSMSGKFRLTVTPDITGTDSDVYMLLMGLAWALHDVSTDRIKRCQLCGNLFLQTTAHNKQYCSKSCADKVIDAKRRGTPARIEIQKRASQKQYEKILEEKFGKRRFKKRKKAAN